MRERALSIDSHVAARALGPGCGGTEESDKEEGPESEEGLVMPDELESEPGLSGKGEGQRWKGRMPAWRCEASFPALPRRPRWCIGMGSACAQVSLVPGQVR